MKKPDELPYEKLEIAHSVDDIPVLTEATEGCEIPGFTADPSLSYDEVVSALASQGWRSQPYSVIFDLRYRLRDKARFVLGLPVGGSSGLHWDKASESSATDTVLRVHAGNAGYVALFATPAGPNHDSLSGRSLRREAVRLWNGEVNPRLWNPDVRLHEGKPKQVIVFRILGGLPVAHDFQPDSLDRHIQIIDFTSPSKN